MSTKMICPKCKSENRDSAKFCDECGCKFERASEKTECDSEVSENADVAPKCENGELKRNLDTFTRDDSTAALPPIFGNSSSSHNSLSQSQNPITSLSNSAQSSDSDPTQPQNIKSAHNSKLDLTGFAKFDENPPHSGDTKRFSRDGAGGTTFDGISKIPSTEAGEVFSDDTDNTDKFPCANTDKMPVAGKDDSTTDGPAVCESDSDKEASTTDNNSTNNNPANDPAPKTIFAPADRAEARARAKQERKREREMRRHDREVRKNIQNNSKSKKKVVVPAVIVGVAAVIALVCVVGYSTELWGGKTVPITAGMSEADAVYTLQQAGFDTRVSKVKSDDTEGIVLMTDPAVGSRVPAGSEVVIHVAESRTIPTVVGLDEQAALIALRESGYSNIADTQYTKTNDVVEGHVISVDPSENSKAKSSRSVTLTVAQNYKVPDVYGMTEANATYTLREAGYYVYLNSVESESLQEGTVYSSDPQAGTVLDKDKYVTIYIVQHRSSKLESLARDYLNSSSVVQISGVTYKIDSVQSVEYQSNGVVNFTIMGSPTTSFLGESITLGSRSVSGAITFNDSNEVVGLG